MEREIKKIKTPVDGHELELKAWLTGREKREISNLFLNSATMIGGKVDDLKITSDIVNKAQDLAFETVVISVDGKTENIIDAILDMKGDDFDFVVIEINKISGDQVEENVRKK